MTGVTYPSSPAAVDPQLLTISPAFRRQVPKVIGAILLFSLVYLLLVIAATGLAIACGWLGVALMMHLANFFVLILGVGIMAVGVSVLVFLIKFVFAVARDERSDRIEISESEQPRLFAFIRQLAGETHAPLPKKIFLSPSVNACVFYNSSFWSMFLPVRKNLEIGLGLVNSVNLSEFKAIIAHEFGHFSQRSMKLGSFTYNVNRVIYNMLYENKDYTAFLQAWGSIHSVLLYFVGLTVKIAGGIQWLLRKVYQVINKTYMGLSREMEFHADLVAASVSGSNNSISALSRIEVASTCYNKAINDANEQLRNKKVARNIYPNQLIVMRAIASDYKVPIRGGLPEFSFHFIESFSRSRINYKDQWASHPTLKERKANLDRLDMPAPPEISPAWQLFDQPETWQQTLTGRLYRSLTLEAPATYDSAEFEARYRDERSTFALPKVFNGFYDNRYIDIKDWNIDALAESTAPEAGAGALFSQSHGQLQSAIEGSRNDQELLKAIRDKKIAIASFDFDGTKYGVGDCDRLIRQLQDEIQTRTSLQQELDKTAFLFFLHRDNIDRERLMAGYRRFQRIHIRCEEFTAIVNRLLEKIRPLYAGKLTLGQVTTIISLLKAAEESRLKKAYRQLLADELLDSPDELLDNPDELLDNPDELNNFLSKDYAYFIDGEFRNDELNELTTLAMKTAEQLNRHRFERYKTVLEVQADSLRS
jgi:Zn-dependent protease with chaperone function